jgi:hypothetical protein
MHIFILPRQTFERATPCYRYLTVRTFSVDFFEKAVHQPYLWSSRIEGELRYNFKVSYVIPQSLTSTISPRKYESDFVFPKTI